MDVCPLCRTQDAREVHRVPYREIFDALKHNWDVHIPPDLAARHTPTADATLVRCSDCNLEYFRGAVPADSDFYGVLMSAGNLKYEPDRWEHRIVRNRLRPSDALVDFGSGPGLFLRTIQGVTRAAGVDYNTDAILLWTKQAWKDTRRPSVTSQPPTQGSSLVPQHSTSLNTSLTSPNSWRAQ